MTKRKQEQISGDQHWNEALYYQNCAARTTSLKSQLKYYKWAHESSISARNTYSLDAAKADTEVDQQQSLCNASLAQRDLVDKFQDRIQLLQEQIEEAEIKKAERLKARQEKASSSTAQSSRSIIISPANSASSSAFFAPTPINPNLINLRTLDGYASLESIPGLVGTPVEKIASIRDRFSSLRTSLIINIDPSTNAQEKADSLFKISQDLYLVLLPWARQELSKDESNTALQAEVEAIIKDSEKAAKSARSVHKHYNISSPTSRECATFIKGFPGKLTTPKSVTGVEDALSVDTASSLTASTSCTF